MNQAAPSVLQWTVYLAICFALPMLLVPLMARDFRIWLKDPMSEEPVKLRPRVWIIIGLLVLVIAVAISSAGASFFLMFTGTNIR